MIKSKMQMNIVYQLTYFENSSSLVFSILNIYDIIKALCKDKDTDTGLTRIIIEKSYYYE